MAQSPWRRGPGELVLARSISTGTPVWINTNRGFLARAIRLGFDEFEVVDADSPVALRDRHRVFCFQPLSEDSAVGPSDDDTRIESPSPGSRPTPKSVAFHKGDSPVTDKTTPVRPPEEGGRPPAGGHPEPGGLAALIREAESLHEALSDARARTGRLAAALREHRRRERLVQSTLASLKALKLRDVAG